MSQPLVPTEIVQKLLEGSFENVARKIEALAEGSTLFGEYKGKVKVIGTFNGYAIVVTENARFAKLLFEHTSDGELVVVGAQPVDVPVYEGTAKLRDFYRKEAGSAVESFFAGKIDTDRVRDLMLALDNDTARTDEQIAANVIESACAERLWKAQYDTKLKSGVLETVLEGADLPAFKAKFTKLYDGSMPSTEAEGYRALVKSDLTKLVGDLDNLAGEVEASFATLSNLIETQEEATKDPSVVDLRAFIKDLLEDLMRAQQSVADVLEQVTTISALGTVHDALSDGLTRQKIAGTFISRVVADMTATHAK